MTDPVIVTRHGTATPTTDDLSDFQLGYDATADILYIRDGAAIVVIGAASFVPYAGATEAVDLGVYGITAQSAIIDGTSTEAVLVRKDADGGDVFVVDTTNGAVGIGVAPVAGLSLSVADTKTTRESGTSVDPMVSYELRTNQTVPDASWSPVAFAAAIYNDGSAAFTNNFAGFSAIASQNGSGTIAIANGFTCQLQSGSAGTITSGSGAYIQAPYFYSTGNITTVRGISIANQASAHSTVAFGLNIGAQSGSYYTWGIFCGGGTNNLVGNTAIGYTVGDPRNIGAKLVLGAGTTAAGTGPLKFTSGALLTTPVAGVWEYLSGTFYLRGGDNLDISTGTITGKLVAATAASDPQHATPANRPTGVLGQIHYYNGKLYFCTNAATPTWEMVTSA